MKFFTKSTKEEDKFMSATDLIEYISLRSSIKINSVQTGKKLKFLGYDRYAKKITGFRIVSFP